MIITEFFFTSQCFVISNSKYDYTYLAPRKYTFIHDRKKGKCRKVLQGDPPGSSLLCTLPSDKIPSDGENNVYIKMEEINF